MRYQKTDVEEPFYFKGYGEDGITIALNLKTIAIDVKIPELSYPTIEEGSNAETNVDQISEPLTDESYFPNSGLLQSHRNIKYSKHKCRKDKAMDKRPSLTRTAHLVAIFHRHHMRRQRKMRHGQPTLPSSNENNLDSNDENENLHENRNFCRTFVPKKALREQNGAISEIKVTTNGQEDDLPSHFNRMSLFDNRENSTSSLSSAENITEMENQNNSGDVYYPQASEVSTSSVVGFLRNIEDDFTKMHIGY
ncbi:unnamed protein product [Hymenolepis diminuta]|uniref:Uncharacterized protein n=1 Tax=Hymenolepis diminuta TaxID=6216 RepID=A0A0R3SBM7_HYMDI|nr:unnamed protein product [Hymenolepis diminuta]VUZ47155.1 unnamed protein product [Hymenolepis diminuta]